MEKDHITGRTVSNFTIVLYSCDTKLLNEGRLRHHYSANLIFLFLRIVIEEAKNDNGKYVFIDLRVSQEFRTIVEFETVRTVT